MRFCLLFIFCINLSCVFEDSNADFSRQCDTVPEANISYTAIKSMIGEELYSFQEELILSGYVISSDRAGNFFKTLHLQESPQRGSEGIAISVELHDSYLTYPVGSRVVVKLKGLYLGYSRGFYSIGSAMNSFGSLAIARMPSKTVREHVLLSCDPIVEIVETPLSVNGIEDSHLNTLVLFEDVEFLDEELGQSYAAEEVETIRKFRDCQGKELGLQNSGYADFQPVIMPEGNGKIRGVLLKDASRYVLKIRDTSDVLFKNKRCPNFGNFISTDSVLITEIADPDNDNSARFIELYNNSGNDIYLNGWTLGRYTNDNTDISSEIDLSGYLIKSKGTLVLSTNAMTFKNVFGFPPDHEVSAVSAADSNGDDNIDLIDPFGNIIDRFGVPGEDGTGTNHEFEDGGAFRKVEIQKGNPQYTFEEWIIYNDSGDQGTINQPLNAPEDYGPGEREH